MIAPAREEALKALLSGDVEHISCEKSSDRRLAEQIVNGTLSNRRFLDACLNEYSASPVRKQKPEVRAILQLSAYQLLFLDRVPASAVVNDAVSLCREHKAAYAAGYCNAVLRRVAENRERLLQLPLPPAVRYSHPDWLCERLVRQIGEDETVRFLKSNQEPPALRLQINTPRCSLENYLSLLLEKGIPVLSVNASLSSLLLSGTEVEKLPGYHDGLFYVQDDAARMAVRFAGIMPGSCVLDACAAPGGKSMAAALDGAGKIVSSDMNQNRLKRCEENFHRLGLGITTVCADAADPPEEWRGAFDTVLADVPCTGSGIIRKQPEIRTKPESALEELLPIQSRILDGLASCVRPGGVLLYSTCSVLREEDEEQIEGFLSRHREFGLELPDTDGAADQNFSCSNGMFRSWPQESGNDGFFAAKLRRL